MFSILNRATHSVSCHKLLTSKNFILRRVSILEKIRPKPMTLDKTNHKVIYEFKYVILPAAFLKTRALLPILSVVFASTCIYLKETRWAVIAVISCVIQFSLVLAVSKLTKNFIGKIYVNKKGNIDNVLISYIDSKGRRIDESYHANKFFCVTETVFTNTLGIVEVEVAGESKCYKMHLRSGVIHDFSALKTLFENVTPFLSEEQISDLKKNKIKT